MDQSVKGNFETKVIVHTRKQLSDSSNDAHIVVDKQRVDLIIAERILSKTDGTKVKHVGCPDQQDHQCGHTYKNEVLQSEVSFVQEVRPDESHGICRKNVSRTRRETII